MKATIRFDMNDESDRAEFDICRMAGGMQSVLWDLDQWLRAAIKYDQHIVETFVDYDENMNELPRNMTKEDKVLLHQANYAIAQKVRDKLSELCSENNVTID